MNDMKKKLFGKRLGALLLALCLSLPIFPALDAPADAAFSDASMDKLQNWGVLSGYPDGSLRPERNLTRAEFVAMVNRAYGYDNAGETPFYDVPESAWYHDDISSAYTAGYFNGVSPHMAEPASQLTREQAVTLLARNMRLDPVAGEVTEFSDGRECADWSRGYIRAAQQEGMISGYPNGTYKPQGSITRGEMSVMLQRALGTLVNAPGTHTLSDVYGNVTISTPNSMLKDTTIAGNLYITGGLDLGDITLENVRVLGDIIVAGGGESQSGKDSIVLRNVEANSLLVDSIADQYVTVRAEGNTEIPKTVLRSDSFIQDRTRPGQGLLNISLESPDTGASFTLSGNLETVSNKTPDSKLTVAMGTVDSLTIDEKARNAELNLDINSTAMELNLDTATKVSGVGDIDKIYINAADTVVDILPDDITIRPGLTSTIKGESMNAAQAIESSSDPRLLAGYPKVRSIASTSATAVFSTNKSGTVYWAISTTTDGSISEDELVSPTEGNTRITLNGSLAAANSNTEYTAALTKLSPDSNYYISTVMVDARNRHSPVKVAAFSTPDDTTPAFTTGYPKVVQNDFIYKKDENGNLALDEDGARIPIFRVQVGAMTNKNCQIYYALYPSGSAQPTAQQFRTGSLGKPIQSGVEDATKNVVWLRTFTGLDELTSYDLYLWLTDADGARSSAVRKLTFTTVDGTPPKFMFGTPVVVGNPPATSIPTKVNVNENATVYWSIVKHGDDFIKAATGKVESPKAYIADLTVAALKATPEETRAEKEKELETLKRKIETGSGAQRNGSSSVTQDRDANVNIAGLTSETAYDIYYVAKDRAGNYSDIAVLEGIRTLDTNPPTVDKLVFSRKNEKNEPYANTDIDIIFSEDIQHYPVTLDANNNAITLASFANASTAAEREEMASFLSSIISLYNDSGLDPNTAIEPFSGTDAEKATADWILDWRKAAVKLDPDTGKVTVSLSTADGAINLKSGATYHFVYNDIQDLATTPNRMRSMPVSSETFRTIAAQVQLRKDVSDAVITSVYGVSGDVNIDIDMSFSLRPVSVNVDENVRWDMLLWSDSTVRFDVYTRERGATTWTKIVPEDGADYSAITVQPNSDTYIAKGLYGHLARIAQPFIRFRDGKDNTYALDPDKVYEYAINFTKVGDSTVRNTWNQEITYRVSVITADTPTAFQRLNSYSGGIGAADYSWMQATQGVLEINTTDSGSEYFTLYKSFSDKSAPEFTQGYPSFTPQDISAKINLMTDRAGTVYWVVAPMSPSEDNAKYSPIIPPTISAKTAAALNLSDEGVFSAMDTAIEASPRFAAYYAPYVSGTANPDTDKKVFIPHNGSTYGAPFLLEQPKISAIYNPNFGDKRVRSGSLRVTGNGVQTIDVPNLEPSTSYYVYFVTQTDGQAIYSDNVQLYQFWTESVYRPKLRIESDGSSVAMVRSRNMDAVADYAVFLMTDLPAEMTEPFYSEDVMGPEYTSHKTALDKIDPKIARTGEGVTRYTVYEALCAQDDEGGTLYDKYAIAAHKDKLRKYITNQTYSGGRWNGSNANLKEDVIDRVDCASKYAIQTGRYYLFIASARSVNGQNATADSYGFCAYQPIFIADTNPPTIATLSGGAYVNMQEATKNGVAVGTMSGQFDVIFDKDIYYSITEATNVPFNATVYDVGSGDTVVSKAYTAFGSSLVGENYAITKAFKTGSSNINSVTLQFKDISYNETATFDVTPNLVGAQSRYDRSTQLHLKLRFDRSDNSVHVDIVSDRGDWYVRTSEALPTVVYKPEPKSISLNPSGTVSLDVGESRTLNVTFQPVGSTGEITWKQAGSSVTMVPSDDSHSMTIIGESAGTTYIRATLYGQAETDGPLSKAVTIVVTANPSVTITKEGSPVSGTVQVSRGKNVTLGATVKNVPQPYTITWSSSVPSGVAVGQGTGIVRAAGAVGDYAIITATVTDANSQTYTARCRVEIVE